ncbi:hypothetical protein SPRG_08292 [Saprolegnia parasitica CBS 223.65]|uniref:Choloylglycine hydrolase/NAAA C-terminal domain-containing protein n=1 Tax=Saprolegnia parasitica (strain CBS 223.65) TaxID=695850 RepID=A0A067C6S3_SAPPC|nr:hypothetical protein SPRG_08292 [Saprolegnia parasitica CBS 223.65]KDO26489.1 hypothetical protein SPRG_08292 [Saprolegnia parasitica CBS 223.65]|eukprot:XP_012202924.1 hypothetical protein SPRG_08292 [Saprolegnia parasitica CBS 223.65]
MMHGLWLVALSVVAAQGCSDFLLNRTNETISARTMDFTLDLNAHLEIVPRGTRLREPPAQNCANNCSSYAWDATYGFVSVNAYGANVAMDGLNEAGLSAAWLWLDATTYRTTDAMDPRPVVTSVVSHLLGTCASVDDVRAKLATIQVAEIDPTRLIMFAPGTPVIESYPLHVAVHDASGRSLVLEILNQTLHVYENPNGVLTNDPPLLDQLAALASATSLPSGYGSTERFVRLSMLNRHRDRVYDPTTSYGAASSEQAAVASAVHFLGTVQTPLAGDNGGGTEFALVRDHARRKLYFQSTQNLNLRMVDLSRIDFAPGAKRRALAVTFGRWVDDVTDALVASTTHSKYIPNRSHLDKAFDSRSTQLAPPTFRGSIPTIVVVVGASIGAVSVIGVALLRESNRQGYTHVG